MREIEVRILEIDRKEVGKKLLALGAKKTFEGELRAVFFDVGKKGLLRLRKEGRRVFLAHKGKAVKRDGARVREETEVEVSDFRKTEKILKGAGFRANGRIQKRRITYTIGNVKFEIDKYKDKYAHIPAYLEIEATNISELFSYAKKLGFRKDQCKPWAFPRIIKHYASSARNSASSPR